MRYLRVEVPPTARKCPAVTCGATLHVRGLAGCRLQLGVWRLPIFCGRWPHLTIRRRLRNREPAIAASARVVTKSIFRK